MAFALLGEGEHAWELFSMLNPISHSDQPEKSELYKVEPYVMCADVYSVAPHTGRGGWTWYTGAAGWMYRLTVETLLGLRLEVDKLRMAPLMPKDWSSYKIHYRYRETFYHIEVVRTEEAPGLSGTETTDGARGAGSSGNDGRRRCRPGRSSSGRHPARGRPARPLRGGGVGQEAGAR